MKLFNFCRIFCVGIFMTIALAIWAFLIEPEMLEVRRYNLHDSELKNLKIVFASDFHIAPHEAKRLATIIDAINAQKADVIFLGGDYVKGHKPESSMPITQIAKQLGLLKAPCGIYAVLGNHDWYIDGELSKHALESQGIAVLENNNKEIICRNQKIFIAGVADKATRTPDIGLALHNTALPRLIITHSPDIFPLLKKDVNLTLAAHTHGGQLKLPLFGALLIPSDYGQRFAEGLIEEHGHRMIVTKGLGTSLLPIRFNCRPEIVVIEFT